MLAFSDIKSFDVSRITFVLEALQNTSNVNFMVLAYAYDALWKKNKSSVKKSCEKHKYLFLI